MKKLCFWGSMFLTVLLVGCGKQLCSVEGCKNEATETGICEEHIQIEKQKEKETAEMAAKLERERQVKIEKYQKQAVEVAREIAEAATVFDKVADVYLLAIKEDGGGLISPDQFLEISKQTATSVIDDEQMRQDNIKKLVDDLDKLDCHEPEMEDIKKTLNTLASACGDRFDFIAKGDFNASNFESLNTDSQNKFSSAISNAVDALKKAGINVSIIDYSVAEPSKNDSTENNE